MEKLLVCSCAANDPYSQSSAYLLENELDAVKAGVKKYADMIGASVPTIDHTNFDMGLRMAASLAAGFEDIPVVIDNEMYTIGSARAKLAEGRQQLAAAEAEYNDKVAQLNAGWAEYNAGQDELNTLVAEGDRAS